MFNLFRLGPKGQWKSKCGKKYTAVCVENSDNHPLKSGWFKSLNDAIAAKDSAKKEPLVIDTEKA